MKKTITIDNVLHELNPYHGLSKNEDREGAIAANEEKRTAFNDLFTTIMDPEHGDVREWDERRWKAIVSLARDLNAFFRAMDGYYKQEWIAATK